MGAILRCKEKITTSASSKVPRAHRAFSYLPFSFNGNGAGAGSQLTEGDDGGEVPDFIPLEDDPDLDAVQVDREGGWLEEDDIEDD